MPDYVFKKYEQGFEIEHSEISKENALEWIWPYYYTSEVLQKKFSQPDFDCDTVLYCFDGKKMVGFIHAELGKGEGVFGPDFSEEEGKGASFDIPRVRKGYEEVVELLLEEMIVIMKRKGIDFLQTRVTTMRKNSIELVESFGFKPHQDFPLGYKLYYIYNLEKGKIDFPTPDVVPFDKSKDLEECSEIISDYFMMTKEGAKDYIQQLQNDPGFVNHIIIRKESKIEAYSYALANYAKDEVIATFYLDASNEEFLKQQLTKTIENSIEKGGKYFLVDVIGDLLQYEEIFVEFGFDKAATWGIYEKRLD